MLSRLFDGIFPGGLLLQNSPSQLNGFDKSYNTILTPEEEKQFIQWKSKYAPQDSGDDYDLRGAFKSGFLPDPKTNHWDDKFKKPNHPTFSTYSKYAEYEPDSAGTWDGDTYMPNPMKNSIMNIVRKNSLLKKYTEPTDQNKQDMKTSSLSNGFPIFAENNTQPTTPNAHSLPTAPDGSAIIPHIRAFDRSVPIQDLSPMERDAIVKFLHGSNSIQGGLLNSGNMFLT